MSKLEEYLEKQILDDSRTENAFTDFQRQLDEVNNRLDIIIEKLKTKNNIE